VTIPAEVRKVTGIKPGDLVGDELIENHVVLKRLAPFVLSSPSFN